MGIAFAPGFLLRTSKRLFLLRRQYRARAVQLVAQARRAHHACAARPFQARSFSSLAAKRAGRAYWLAPHVTQQVCAIQALWLRLRLI